MGDAFRVRGDIHAAIGDIEAAREDFAQAYAAGWDAEPGNAILLYEAGDVDGALAALDRVLAGVGWFSLQRQGWLLANKARICALSGRHDDARECLGSLMENYDQWPSAAIRALATEASANLPASGAKDEHSPVQRLHLARQLWTSIGAEYHAGRVRLDLAELLRAKRDGAGARVEVNCALTSAERIGAKRLRQRAIALANRLSDTAGEGD
jgi:tetratricopeptide (TPR) repeat protein